MSAARHWKCTFCSRISAGKKCRRCGKGRQEAVQVLVLRGGEGTSQCFPGHEERIALYRSRAERGLPLFKDAGNETADHQHG